MLSLNFLSLFILFLFFKFWNVADKRQNSFFSKQNWNIGETVIWIVLLDLFALSYKWLNNSIYNETFSAISQFLFHPLSVLILYGLISRGSQNPIADLGLTKNHTFSMIMTGLKWSLAISAIIYFSVLLFSDDVLLRIYNRQKNEPFIPLVEFNKLYFGMFGFLFSTIWFLGLESVFEEIIYRGILYGALRKKINSGTAIFISSLLFMFAHNWKAFSVFGIGCLAAYLYEKYHSLVPAILIHIFYNLSNFILKWVIKSANLRPKMLFELTLGISISGFCLVSLILYYTQKRSDRRANEIISSP